MQVLRADDHPIKARIVFTGDLDAVLETQERDLNGLYVQRCWDFARVLFDYAERKTNGLFAGNVHSYLQSNEHDGTKVTITRHAPGETETTLGRWGEGTCVPGAQRRRGRRRDRDVRALQSGPERHVRSPRLHYFDDTDHTGKVYVGYIGRHLTNTKTRNA